MLFTRDTDAERLKEKNEKICHTDNKDKLAGAASDLFQIKQTSKWASQLALMVKNLPVYLGDVDSIPGLGRSPGGGQGNPLQYYCLENPMDRGAWRATVDRIAKNQT